MIPQLHINLNSTQNLGYGLNSGTDATLCLGALGKNMTNGDTTYKNVRLYNRSLTDDELAHNYEVDKARFNLS